MAHVDQGAESEHVPLVAPTMTTMPMPDARLFNPPERRARYLSLLDEIKSRAVSLPTDPESMAHATADRLVETWYPYHPERRELLVELFMFAGHGAAAKVLEQERFGITRGLVALPVHSALASMYWGIADMPDADSKGVEPMTWKRRNGYALIGGYYAARIQGTEVLDLLVLNSEDF